MGFWPFVRRNKRSTHNQTPNDEAVDEKMARGWVKPPGNQNDIYGGVAARTDSKRRRTNKSTAMSESSTFQGRESTATPTAAEEIKEGSKPTIADSNDRDEVPQMAQKAAKVYEQNPRSNSSFGPEHITVFHAPTLHAKRSGNEPKNETSLLRRKSSKRKAEDREREREIRAMSSPVPIPKRPASYSESPLRRDTQKTPGRLSKRRDRHSSDISLPIPEPLSDLGVLSNSSSYEVRAMDMLRPRPTLRHSANPRLAQSRARESPQQMIVEEDYHSRQRIDTLADSLDASALRELMERDQRRRERKRRTEQVKLEQKLKRRAEYDKERDIEKSKIQESEVMESITQKAAASAKARRDGKKEALQYPTDPFSDTAAAEAPTLRIPSKINSRDPIYARKYRTDISPPTSPTQLAPGQVGTSHITALPQERSAERDAKAKSDRRTSEQATAQRRSSLASLFRRSGQADKRSSVDRGRHTTSPTSPTGARDLDSKNQIPLPPVATARTYRRSGTPQRTRSRFREDLPELPLSPPDSRVHSPDVDSARLDQSEPIPDYDQALLPQTTQDQPEKDPFSDPTAPITNEVPASPPAAPLSQQLASVDAEATWLSGKPTKKPSVRRENPLTQNQAEERCHRSESDNGEETDVTNDPYFRALSPEVGGMRKASPGPIARKASSTALNIEDESDADNITTKRPPLPTGEEKWHSSVGKQALLVRQPAQARSKEGLLKEYIANEPQTGVFEDEASELESPDTEEAEASTNSPILRAQSVNYGGGHVRHISAGSAKLLDIRTPSDSKRNSLPRSERATTPNRAGFPREDQKAE